ncbi:hypothetical protein ACQJBY_037384 [Aegilops geniculata]
MKIFLDTTRLLAEKTNNLLEELWKYIEDGKLIQSAVLLLAAQEQIRGGCSSPSKKDGFDILKNSILRLSFSLMWDKGSNAMAPKCLEEMKALNNCAGLLVDVISRAGEHLSAYIQSHSEAVRKEAGGGWDPTYARRRFFPYWRSVLQTRFPVKVYPSYARTDARSGLDLEKLRASLRNSMANGSTPTPNIGHGPVGRISPLTRNSQPTRRFITTATCAFKLLKALK